MPRESDEIHKNLIKAMVGVLVKQGFEVKADHIDYEGGAPDSYGGKIPDIFAIKNGKKKIFVEAETCDSISLDHTKEQCQIFSDKIGFEFWIIAPKECINELKSQLKEWKITTDAIYSF